MPNTLAIAAITAVLKHLLENGLAASNMTASIGGDVAVTALPPDRVTTGADERAQLNLSLYQATPNTALRSLAAGMGHATPGLALDLHYLVTAYGAAEFQIEILLGCALQLFQQTPVLESAAIGAALDALSSTKDGRVVSAPAAALAGSNLAEQIERIKVEPQFLSLEEQSKLWSALQARYRLSAAYKVSAVFIGD